ncbi:zinc finger CCHC domain-containing protein 8-like isoform X2 [Dysidea avara]|uniref:zinc finger CCHC domain-containing protein 8-like isoform X2 n=1 Tax=Dysidea avara TaxID=196820 RepID=UPI003333F4D1
MDNIELSFAEPSSSQETEEAQDDDETTLTKDELITKLKEEIVELRRRLHLFNSLGSGMDGSHGDGPMASVIYFNTKLSRKRRKDLERCCVGKDNWCAEEGGNVTTSQESSLDVQIIAPGAVLKAVGAVEYYSGYCIDRLGVPVIVDLDKEFKADYEHPSYLQVYLTPFWSDSSGGKTTSNKEKKSASRSKCFNCGGDHVLRDCPLPRNPQVINQNRSKFEANTPQLSKNRYHADEDNKRDQRFSYFVPGSISEKLCNALGITKDSIPPYISRMKKLGYPPGYQMHHHDKQNFVLALYDDNDSRPTGSQSPDSMIQYPGFNCEAKQNDRSKNHKRKRAMSDVSTTTCRPAKTPRLSDEHDHYGVVDMVMSDEELEEGEINSATNSKDNSRRSSTTEKPLLKKRFSLDFPPSLLSPGEETPTTPNRWNTIKDILDRSKT